MAFKASQSVTAVTKRMHVKEFKYISILDSPGFNDPDKTRTDSQTFIDMTYALNDNKIFWGGVASLLQCVMVPTSGRINSTAIELMSKILQFFTLSYPDREMQGP